MDMTLMRVMKFGSAAEIVTQMQRMFKAGWEITTEGLTSCSDTGDVILAKPLATKQGVCLISIWRVK